VIGAQVAAELTHHLEQLAPKPPYPEQTQTYPGQEYRMEPPIDREAVGFLQRSLRSGGRTRAPSLRQDCDPQARQTICGDDYVHPIQLTGLHPHGDNGAL